MNIQKNTFLVAAFALLAASVCAVPSTNQTVASQASVSSQAANVPAEKKLALKTVLTGDPKAEDSVENPRNILPQTLEIAVGASFMCDARAYSLLIVRIKAR